MNPEVMGRIVVIQSEGLKLKKKIACASAIGLMFLCRGPERSGRAISSMPTMLMLL